MKRETIYILLIVVFTTLSSCAKKRVSEEMCDKIQTTTFCNTYDKEGRLAVVSIQELKENFIDGELITIEAENIVKMYDYLNDSTYRITETSDQYPENVNVYIFGAKSEERITIINGIDTVFYDMSVYLDKDKSKSTYYRLRIRERPYSADIKKFSENNEQHSSYDDKGHLVKIVKRDFITRSSKETYVFYNVPYVEAEKLAPQKKNREIACCIEKMSGDTIITHYQLNGETTYYEKKYRDGDKTVTAKFDANYKLIEKSTQYKESNRDVAINEVSALELIDSIYSIAGREIRKVSIYPDYRFITTSEYDKRENLIKTVEKSYFTDTEKIMNDMLQLLKETENP